MTEPAWRLLRVPRELSCSGPVLGPVRGQRTLLRRPNRKPLSIGRSGPCHNCSALPVAQSSRCPHEAGGRPGPVKLNPQNERWPDWLLARGHQPLLARSVPGGQEAMTSSLHFPAVQQPRARSAPRPRGWLSMISKGLNYPMSLSFSENRDAGCPPGVHTSGGPPDPCWPDGQITPHTQPGALCPLFP